MKRTLAVLAGLALAVALPALAGADESPRPTRAKAKSKKAPSAVAVTAKATPAEDPAEVEDPEASMEESATEPKRTLRVLDNPYDISSFYRAEGGGGTFTGQEATADRYPIAGFYRAEGGQGPYAIAGYYRQDGGSGRYPIAGFYRQGARGAYGSFWNSGYGPGQQRGRGRVLVGYRRSIGENGDIFLIAPFLAPVGPLSEAFLR